MRLLSIALAAGLMLGIGNSQAQAPEQLRVAVLLVNFSDNVQQPWAPAYISQEYNCCDPVNGRGVADFITKASWGQTSLNADVFGWFVTDVATGNCQIQAASTAAESMAAAQGIDLSQYTNRVYIFPYSTACSWIAGTSDGIGGYRSWIVLDPTFCPDSRGACQSWHLFAHELGHNLGLWHASRLSCVDEAGQPVTLSDNCTLAEYMDGYDVMGCCGSELFSNFNRARAGWIPAAKQVTIAESGDYTITPAGSQSSNIYRIADGAGYYLYLENRNEPSSAYTLGHSGSTLLIRRSADYFCPVPCSPSPPGGNTALLDANPGGNGDALPLGATAIFPHTPATITNLSFDGTNNLVRVGGLAPPPRPQCSDGIDNDGDGKIDYPADRQCTSAADDNEKKR